MSAPISTSQQLPISLELTRHIGRTVASVPIQVVIGEAGPRHQPGCLSDDLWSVSIAITVNTIEHLAIA